MEYIFNKRHVHFLRSAEGTYAMIGDMDILTITDHLAIQTDFILNLEAYATGMHSLLHYCCCSDGFDSVKEETYDCLYRAVLDAKTEGFSGMDIVLYIELHIIDVTNEEDIVTLSMRETTGGIGPAPRSSIDALPVEFIENKRNLLEYGSCTVCMDEFTVGMMATKLPCSHSFHVSCIEKWLSQTNSCPLCRASI